MNVFKYYSLIEFVEYLNHSTEFIDPLTREKISLSALNNISSLLKYYKINSVKYNKILKKNKDKRTDYLLITFYINDVINYTMDTQDINLNNIYNTILPQLMYYFQFMLSRHRNSCRALINQYINTINNHSNENKNYIIDYLKLIIAVNNL